MLVICWPVAWYVEFCDCAVFTCVVLYFVVLFMFRCCEFLSLHEFRSPADPPFAAGPVSCRNCISCRRFLIHGCLFILCGACGLNVGFSAFSRAAFINLSFCLCHVVNSVFVLLCSPSFSVLHMMFK